MAEIIDLDVYVPEKKVITFTIIKGQETKRRLTKHKERLASAQKDKKVFSRLFNGLMVFFLTRKLKKYSHVFDITNMSFGATAFILAHIDKFVALSKANPATVNEEDYKLLLGIIEEIAVKSDKMLTADFLYENLYLEQSVMLMTLAMGTITGFLQNNPQDGAAAAEQVAP